MNAANAYHQRAGRLPTIGSKFTPKLVFDITFIDSLT
jgi:hypothetical protein